MAGNSRLTGGVIWHRRRTFTEIFPQSQTTSSSGEDSDWMGRPHPTRPSSSDDRTPCPLLSQRRLNGSSEKVGYKSTKGGRLRPPDGPEGRTPKSLDYVTVFVGVLNHLTLLLLLDHPITVINT